MAPLIFVCVVAFGCTMAIYVSKRFTKPTCPLPPGPPGLPWIGNFIGVDRNAPWLTYHNWAKTYGDIIYARLLSKDIIIVNSEKMAKELFEHHSSNSSDRPRVLTGGLSGIDFASALLPYGDRWRLHRRFLHQTFRIDAVQRFLPFQHHKACQFLRRLFIAPGQLEEHVLEYVITIALKSAYDYDTSSNDDELFKLAGKMREILPSVARPNIAILVDTFPMLLKLPAWLPGMSFKKEMMGASKLIRQYIETAFECASQRARDGSISPSMVYDALENVKEKGTVTDEFWIKALKESSATVLGGGEASTAVLMMFFILMALNPEVQEKAQAQIDAVTGKGRLPTMDDRPFLPFVDAILRETIRYGLNAPLSVPHAAVDDFVYRGLHIPKGAILVANVWAVAHDESRYPNSHAFLPERFINDDGSLKPNDIEHITYGFGRRICPGRHFADTSIWSVMAKVLAVFKILKPLNENGEEVPLEVKFTSGLSRRLLPYQCRFVPRMQGMNAEMLEELIAASTA